METIVPHPLKPARLSLPPAPASMPSCRPPPSPLTRAPIRDLAPPLSSSSRLTSLSLSLLPNPRPPPCPIAVGSFPSPPLSPTRWSWRSGRTRRWPPPGSSRRRRGTRRRRTRGAWRSQPRRKDPPPTPQSLPPPPFSVHHARRASLPLVIQGRGVLTAACQFFPRQACDSMLSWATATVSRRLCSPLLRPPPPRELHWPPVHARSKAGGPARRQVGDTPRPQRFAEFGIDYKPAMLQRFAWRRSRDTREWSRREGRRSPATSMPIHCFLLACSRYESSP